MRLLIDTDTASDDAVALLLALRTPDVDVDAITVVAGNVEVEQGVQNALYTVELAGKSTPVYAGRTGTTHFGHAVHGNDGMGDIGLPLRGREPAPGDAVDGTDKRTGRRARTVDPQRAGRVHARHARPADEHRRALRPRCGNTVARGRDHGRNGR